MRELLLILLLAAAAMAAGVDSATGCEKYNDHVVCPQGTDVGMEVQYSTDADCYSLQNEYGQLEEIGCYATATLTKPLSYESCKMYVPFNSKDVQLDKINYKYQCSTERLPAGQVVYMAGFQKDFGNCTAIEENSHYGEYSCPIKGEKYFVNGSIEYDKNYTVIIYSQEKESITGLATPLVEAAVALLVIYAAYAWTERKR